MNEARYRDVESRVWTHFGVQPTERWLDLARTGARVRALESGAGLPVVFLHGANVGAWSWAPLVAQLQDFRCIVLDRPGCGLSPALTTNFDDVAQLQSFADAFVVDVLDALGLDAADVVATSYGGYFALRAAAAHPERLRRLVEMSWPIGAPMARMPAVMRMTGIRSLGLLMARVPTTRRMARSMLAQVGLRDAIACGKMPDVAIDCFVSLLNDTATMANELRTGPRIVLPVKGVNTSILHDDALLASIRTPVHFFWGEQDPFGGAEVARAFVPRIPGATLQLVPGGHAPFIDDPVGASDAVRRFCSG